MVSQRGTRVFRPNSCKGQIYLEKEPKGQTKILGPGSVIWDLIFEIWANLVTLLTPKESFDPQIESTRNP